MHFVGIDYIVAKYHKNIDDPTACGQCEQQSVKHI